MEVHTDEKTLKFKFKSARDFHSVVDALRNTIHNDKPFYTTQPGYDSTAQNFTTANAKVSDNSSISSDDAKDYNLENQERDRVKRAKQNVSDKYNGDRALMKEDYKDNRDNINHNYEVNRDQIRHNSGAEKDQIKHEYKAAKDSLDN